MDQPGRPAGPTQISAITLGVSDMPASIRFYSSLGFAVLYGGPDETFTSFQVGPGFLNLQYTGVDPLVMQERASHWGRPIFYVPDVDATHAAAIAAGYQPEAAPRDAPWGERYFHVRDPDGHEISFARPL
jgi:catechol 2,3-dioxygenase-like lactoylglutathione lyase family enzyme